jgi:hypothetical protein
MKSKKEMQNNIHETRTLELSITKQYEARRASVPVEERNIKRATQPARRNGTRATAGGREGQSHFSRLARFEEDARGVLMERLRLK